MKAQFYIDTALQDRTSCTVISPRHTYDGNLNKIPRDAAAYEQLEQAISDTMQQLANTLQEDSPSLYIDCSQKGTDPIAWFILKKYIAQAKLSHEQKTKILGKAIGDHSIVTESSESRRNYIQTEQPHLETIIQKYEELLIASAGQNSKDEARVYLANCESGFAYNCLSDVLKAEDIKAFTIYLDNVHSLTLEEQKRINTLLFSRGSLDMYGHRRVHLKINNGADQWKTWRTPSQQFAQATHDYSEASIGQDDLSD